MDETIVDDLLVLYCILQLNVKFVLELTFNHKAQLTKLIFQLLSADERQVPHNLRNRSCRQEGF